MYRFFKFIISSFLISLLVLVLIFLNASFEISKDIGKPANYLIKTIYQASNQNPYLSKDKINFIVLGLDERNDSLEVTQTTDTIIFVSLNLKTFKINTISLPRDLWSYNINAKINQIYPLSLNQSDKFSYIKDNFKYITGQDIDHVVIVNTNNLINFVKLVGGVDLNLDVGFIDKQYPNPDYIASPSASIPIYKTVEFKSGPIHLDESNITEFVRSRHGAETAAQGGTDIGRIHRQQLLLEALISKIKSGSFVLSKDQLSGLYKLWDQEIIKDINDTQIFQIFSTIGENIYSLNLNKIEIKIGESAKDSVIYHPNKFINSQWVYIPSELDYKSLQEFISSSI